MTAIYLQASPVCKKAGYFLPRPVDQQQKLEQAEKPFILDVRGPGEFEVMRLDIGETLIHLEALRKSLDKLPDDKNSEIIAFCKNSLRGYEVACCLKGLKGYFFRDYDLLSRVI